MKPAATADNRELDLVVLSLLAVLVGCVTGVGAMALRYLISLVHNVLFLGEFSFFYDANLPTPPSPLGPLVILVPVIGGAVVVFLVSRFAPEARGHGVPEVMDAIYYKGGRIRPAVVVVKSVASALSIGSGASVGREGPIIQIGSAIGSVLGQVFRLRTWQIITLVAAGAGAGIAATFNTPLGAVMFAVELMLPGLSARTFLPVVLATGTATYVGRLAFGIEPAFLVVSQVRPDVLTPVALDTLPISGLLGVLCGVGAMVFVRTLHRVEDLFDAMPFNAYVRNAIGMLAIGVLMYAMLLGTGSYQTAGVGYATIQSILSGEYALPWLLLLLFAAKLFATTVSLGAGASGGIFSPSLFLGATLGGAFGAILDAIWPGLALSPIAFALIGMGAMVGGATGAAMTAILMIFEMTGDYGITVSVIVAVACAIGTRRALLYENIYTMKLARRGHHIPKDRHMHMFQIRHASDVMRPVVGAVERGALRPAATGLRSDDDAAAYSVVVENGRIDGVVPVDPDDPHCAAGPVIGRFGVAREGDFLQGLMERMARRGHKATLVVRGGSGVPRPDNVVGVVGREGIADAIIDDYGR